MIKRTYLGVLDSLFGFLNVSDHTFYSKKLYPSSIVLDLGANLGYFSKYITSKYQCQAFVVEASPELFAQIDDTPLIHKYNYAVAGNDGFVTFYESSNILAGNIVSPKSNSTGNTFDVKSRTFASLLAEIGIKEIDLLKIDIEGAEIELFDNINDQDLNCIKQLTIEFHDSVPIPNVSTEDVKRVIDKIISMGFDGIAMGRKNFNWLFLNRKKMHLPVMATFYLKLRKYIAKFN